MAMSGYTKLFSSILASTVWREDDKTRLVWITLLAMAGKDGVAEGSVPGVADFSRVSVEDCRAALQKLADPDPDSRSKEYGGARIMALDDGSGWQILNHAKYRRKMNEDERREYLRNKQAEYRARQHASTGVNTCQQVSTGVSDKSTPSTQAEAEAEADTESKAEAEAEAPSSSRLDDSRSLSIHDRNVAKRKTRCAFVSERFDVPNGLHRKFCDRYGSGADAVVQAWYLTVLDSLGEDESLPADIFAWLPARFDAWLVTTGRVKAPPPKPTAAAVLAAKNAESNRQAKAAHAAEKSQGIS